MNLPMAGSGVQQIESDLGIAINEILNVERIRNVIQKLEWQDFSTLTQKAMSSPTPFPSWMDFFPGKAGKKEEDEGGEGR
jgi:hypothetical protein